MKLLLDTHILLWALFDCQPLTKKARMLIEDPSNTIFASIVSLWEIAIKFQKWPREFPYSEDLIDDLCDDAGFGRFDIRTPHILALRDLNREESAPEHKDPFDRMLLAQAKEEGAMLLTHDKRLAEYGEPCVVLV